MTNLVFVVVVYVVCLQGAVRFVSPFVPLLKYC